MKYNTSSPTVGKGIIDMPSTRLQAKMLGSTKYATGKPCRKGHTTYRYTTSGICASCAATRAKQRYAGGWRQDKTNRPQANRAWNASAKAAEAKQRWKDKDPKRAWAVSATGGAKSRAALAGISFDITSEYILSITPDVCPVFGTSFVFIGNRKVGAASATLDKLNPNLGYVEGNVAVISRKANMIKSAYGSTDIEKVAAWLAKMGL
jgi:hypothetical protein